MYRYLKSSHNSTYIIDDNENINSNILCGH